MVCETVIWKVLVLMSITEIIFKQCVALDTIKVTSKGSENKHHGSGAAGANEYPAQLFTFQVFWSSWLGTRDSICPFRYEPFE